MGTNPNRNTGRKKVGPADPTEQDYRLLTGSTEAAWRSLARQTPSFGRRDVRKVDIAHDRQTVPEAVEQLVEEIKAARRDGERILLVVHGFGASGAGGAI